MERSIICNGASIYGEVHNSILGSRVRIGKGTIIRDSIIMNETEIGENCVVDKAIIAENVKVGDNVTIGIGSDKPNKMRPDIYNSGLATIGEKSVFRQMYKLGKIPPLVV